MKKYRKLVLGAFLVLCVAGVCSYGVLADKEEDETDSGKAQEQQIEEKRNQIKEIYTETYQNEIANTLEQEKENGTYTLSDPFVKENPFGTNTLSLYLYFETEKAARISYTVHVNDKKISDFTRFPYEQSRTEHEFSLMGLIPSMENQITVKAEYEDGTVETKEFTYSMGNLLGNESVKLDVKEMDDTQELADGLYVILGNDSEELDFMYYYDDEGILRGEVPIIGYRSHRLLFDDSLMYYSISETKMAAVNRLGQVEKIYDLGNYKLHHDYVFDDEGNLLILASDTTQESVEDVVVSLDKESGEVAEILDLGDIFGEYKETCVENSDGDLDWMHINTIQWMGNGEILLSSRETSTIIKIIDIYGTPTLDYLIGSGEFWAGTGYESNLLQQNGGFTLQGGQHSITYQSDDSLEDGSYYLYLFDNHIGVSETRPDFDWSSVGDYSEKALGGDASYYYKYLVNEKEGTVSLVSSFAVPYSGYVSSVQEKDGNIVVDSGMPGVFGEYDSEGNLLKEFGMEHESFIYRVFKYDFEGFYFVDEE